MFSISRLDTGKLWLIFGFACLTLFFFFQHWIFFETFDPKARFNLYERSQWSIPESPRRMGDAELYQVSGYDLLRGGSPFAINPEVPPLAKYFYGASIHLTGNPYWASIAFFFGCALVFWIVTGLVWIEKTPRYIALGIFLSTPHLLVQMTQTMLDTPQLMGLLFHIFAAIKTVRSSRPQAYLWACASGLGFGVFLSTKIGVFAPAVFLSLLSLIPFTSSIALYIIIGGVASFVYFFSYLPVLLSGLSPLDWLRNQKWMLTFYASSKLPRLPWVFPGYVLTGFFTQHAEEKLRWITDWTPLWSLSFTFLATHFRALQKQNPVWRYLFTLTLSLSLMLLITPFFPRYIILISPFLILFFSQFLWKSTRAVQLSFLLMSFGWLLWNVQPKPHELADQLTQLWEAGAYEEVYDLLSPLDRLSTSRETFVYLQKNIDHSLQVSDTSISIEFPSPAIWSSQTTGSLSVERTTPLGVLTTQHPLPLLKERGRWRVDWNWNMTLSQFDPQAEIHLELEPKPYGSLESSDHLQLSAGGTRPFLTVYPANITDSEAFIRQMEPILLQTGKDLRNTMYVHGEGLGSVPLGFVVEGLNEEELQALRSHPALSVEDRPARVHQEKYLLPNGTTMLDTYEKEHPELEPEIGGRVYLRWSSGKEIELLSRQGKPGQDVRLDVTSDEIQQKVTATE